MNYSLIRLRFDGLAHFGTSDSALSLFTSEDHFYADTLFSALCHTALSLHGIDGLHSLLQQAADGSLLLSDSMPWHRTAHGVDYYLPKPCRTFSRLPQKQDMPQGSRKAMKKLAWIPVRSFSDFWRSIAGEASYQPQPDAFGTLAGRTQAAVSDETDAVPYQVGAYRFFPDCGLYVLIGCKEQRQLDYCAELFTVLGLSGIGGKTSVGYGRFTVEEQIRLDDSDDSQLVFLQHALADASAPYQLLLTTSLPRDDELEQTMQHAQYRLIRRSGFIQSNTFNAEPFKKQTQYYLAAGATCTQRYHGDLYTVAESGNHPVYRYSKPMFLGVKA